jgi:cullin 1
LADVIWKDHLFLPLHKRLTNSMLALIKLDRDGENIETAVVGDTVKCYGKLIVIFIDLLTIDNNHNWCVVRLGMNKENPKMSTLDVYKTYFEAAFLEATDVYYTVEATTFLHENGVSEYMKKVQARISEETQRVRTYLHTSSEKPLLQKLVDVLVRRAMPVLQSKVIARASTISVCVVCC